VKLVTKFGDSGGDVGGGVKDGLLVMCDDGKEQVHTGLDIGTYGDEWFLLITEDVRFSVVLGAAQKPNPRFARDSFTQIFISHDIFLHNWKALDLSSRLRYSIPSELNGKICFQSDPLRKSIYECY
jgi:hypothetical protein